MGCVARLGAEFKGCDKSFLQPKDTMFDMTFHSLFRRLRSIALPFALMAALLTPALVEAQYSTSYNFLKAVRERDGKAATDLLNRPGTTVVNTRDLRSGETPLLIVTGRRDLTWMGFLLQRGANPNLADKEGLTPLMLATNLRFADGAKLLLDKNADVDQTNNSGETALIRAVQLRDPEMVRVLLNAGADPDKTDTIAGQSARDYAGNDARTATILQMIKDGDEEREAKKKAAPVFGPKIN